MLSLAEARDAVMRQATRLPAQSLSLLELNGHYLAEPVTAKFQLPPFDNSAVDGFGVLLKDVEQASESAPVALRYLGEVKAGSSSDPQIEPGTTIKILTGARVPNGVEAVIMREYCDHKDGFVHVTKRATQAENVRYAGGEFAEGVEVMPAGIIASPPVVGLLANFGHASFPVVERPRVAIVVTGDELIQPGQVLAPGQIYDSNSFAMRAALIALGITEIKIIHAKDTAEDTKRAFGEALDFADLVVSSGGVSVGDYDYVKDVLEEMGVQTVFWRVKIKPGKPVYFGTSPNTPGRGNKLVFGLPGNPVSVLVTYHQFVKPALAKMMGKVEQTDTGAKFTARIFREPGVQFTARVSSSLKKIPGRLDLVRGRLATTPEGRLMATPTTGQDSHMLSGLATAECLIHFEADLERLPQDSLVAIEYIDWNA